MTMTGINPDPAKRQAIIDEAVAYPHGKPIEVEKWPERETEQLYESERPRKGAK